MHSTIVVTHAMSDKIDNAVMMRLLIARNFTHPMSDHNVRAEMSVVVNAHGAGILCTRL